MEPEKQKINPNHGLLMEDDEACQRIMTRFLQQLNYEVDLADEGEKAIQLAQDNPYDLIIVDIRLYGMISGKDVIQYLRNSELNASTPLIVWSAFVNRNDEEKYLSWGADRALIKWCSYKLLENTIQKCLKQ